MFVAPAAGPRLRYTLNLTRGHTEIPPGTLALADPRATPAADR